MNHALEVELIERVLKLLEQGTTHMAEGQAGAPVERYLSPERFAREERTLFRRRPLILGHVSRLAAPGDFLTHDLAGVPILGVRDRGGRFRAFLNVCRHRGARVVEARSGRDAKSFACPYHAWTYGLDGRLLGLPHAEGFPEVARETAGLVELPAAEFAGFLWAVPTPGPALDARAALGPLAEEIEALGLATHALHDTRRIEKAMNWKLAFDIFLEAYHVRRTHAETIRPLFLDNVALFDFFSPHLRNLFPKRTIAALRGADPAAWRLRDHANILYVLAPNTAMLVQPDHVSVQHVFPRGPGRVEIEAHILVPEAPATDKARRYWDANAALLYAAIEEDFRMGESIQRGLASGANARLTFGRFEQALANFHAAVDSACEEQ